MDERGSPKHRVVIVGGGFGGLPPTRLLGKKRLLGKNAVEVTLIDRRNHHLFQPLLYQVATGMLAPRPDRPGAASRRAPEARTSGSSWPRSPGSTSTGGSFTPPSPGYAAIEIPYDSLIVAAGVTQSYFGHDEFALYAPA